MTPTPNDFTVRISSIKEQNGAGASGHIEPQMLVTFMVGPHGPFTKTFPKTGFDPTVAKSDLAQFAANLRHLAS